MSIHTSIGKSTSMENLPVSFRVCDIYLPEAEKVLNDLFGEKILRGTLVDYTSNGIRESMFAIIKVEGLSYLLIVPVEKIRGVESVEQG